MSCCTPTRVHSFYHTAGAMGRLLYRSLIHMNGAELFGPTTYVDPGPYHHFPTVSGIITSEQALRAKRSLLKYNGKNIVCLRLAECKAFDNIIIKFFL